MSQEHKEKIYSFFRTNRRMPNYREIMKIAGFRSTNAAYKLVERLVNEGLLAKDAQGKLIPSSTFGEVPLLGLVEAGIPSTVDADVLDTISLDEYLIGKKGVTFLLEVKGDSMIEAHIEEGDYVVAERAEDARHGDIVVAEVDGEWTLKFFQKKAGKTWLLPANARYKPIYPTQSLRVAAVVRGVIRKY